MQQQRRGEVEKRSGDEANVRLPCGMGSSSCGYVMHTHQGGDLVPKQLKSELSELSIARYRAIDNDNVIDQGAVRRGKATDAMRIAKCELRHMDPWTSCDAIRAGAVNHVI